MVIVGNQVDLARGSGFGAFPNATLLTMMLSSLVGERYFPKTKFFVKSSYDYVIVGGGPAGSVMASRLSEKPCVNVLLLEAGGLPPIVSEIPAYARLLYRSPIDWQYQTEPQKYGAFSQRENRVTWNSGKVLGGGSVMNAMMYVRGNRRNYDQWEAEGAEGWSYEDVLPYFLKTEDNRNIEELDPGYHRRGGPLSVERINYTPIIKNPILQATADMGYEERDINGRRQTGMFDLQGMLRNQRRCSAVKAYLVPVDQRPNLDIVKNAFVRKILIKNRRAVGVEFDHLLSRRVVMATKEVIVSAGAVRTTQLLMLSGIGPREELRKFNISVIADLPVGRNLMDHYAAPITYQLSPWLPLLLPRVLSPINILDYAINRRGPLAAPNQITVLAFLDGLNTTSRSPDFPRQELYFAEYTIVDGMLNMQLRDEVFKEVYAPYKLIPTFQCVMQLLQPKSRGFVTLRSTDPRDYPVIDPKYYSHPDDIRYAVEGIKVCNAVVRHPALRRIGARPLETVYPACKKFLGGDEDKYLECVARQVILTIWHPCGTARMGHPRDPRSVVDPQLRVIGIKSLRVINAAVMPIIPSANLESPTMMIAEKVYDIMKDDVECVGTRQAGRSKRATKQRKRKSSSKKK